MPHNFPFAHIFCKILYPYTLQITIRQYMLQYLVSICLATYHSPIYFAISCIHMPRNLQFAHIFCNILYPYTSQLTIRPYILQYLISICLTTYHSPIYFAIPYIHTPGNLPIIRQYILQYLISICLATQHSLIYFAISYIHTHRNLPLIRPYILQYLISTRFTTYHSPIYFAICDIHTPRNLPLTHIFCNILYSYASQLTNRPYILQYLVSIRIATYHSPIYVAISYIHTLHNLSFAYIFCNILYPYASQLTIRPYILQYLISICLTTYHSPIYFAISYIHTPRNLPFVHIFCNTLYPYASQFTNNLPIYFAISYIHMPRNLPFAHIFCKTLYPYASQFTNNSPIYFVICDIHTPRNLPFAHIFCNILYPYASQLTIRLYILQYLISILLATYHSPIYFAILYIHTPRNYQ